MKIPELENWIMMAVIIAMMIGFSIYLNGTHADSIQDLRSCPVCGKKKEVKS